jgi:hypothetical protein
VLISGSLAKAPQCFLFSDYNVRREALGIFKLCRVVPHLTKATSNSHFRSRKKATPTSHLSSLVFLFDPFLRHRCRRLFRPSTSSSSTTVSPPCCPLSSPRCQFVDPGIPAPPGLTLASSPSDAAVSWRWVATAVVLVRPLRNQPAILLSIYSYAGDRRRGQRGGARG